MKTKHTPGPWELLPRGACNVKSQSGRSICTTSVYTTNTDNGEHISENEANAKLIAAAPELLEACISALKLLNKEELSLKNVVQHGLLEKAIKKATE